MLSCFPQCNLQVKPRLVNLSTSNNQLTGIGEQWLYQGPGSIDILVDPDVNLYFCVGLV